MSQIAPILLSELGDYEPIPWFWEGFAAPFRKTIFVGHPKAGKTTLMSHLVKGLSGRTTNVGPKVLPCKTLILTEEHADLWKRRRDDLNIDGTKVYIQRIQRSMNQEDWMGTLSDVTGFMHEKGLQCLIIDTLSALWPCQDENDAIAVGRALDPLSDLANDGFSVIAVHHAPKAKQSAVISARGSTAITAFFDIVVNMRVAGKGSHSTRRSLKSWGRDLETPESLMLDFRGSEGYTMTITNDDDEDEYTEQLQNLDIEKVATVLGTVSGPQGQEFLRETLNMSPSTLIPILNRGVDNGDIVMQGKGVKGAPYLYSTPTSQAVSDSSP